MAPAPGVSVSRYLPARDRLRLLPLMAVVVTIAVFGPRNTTALRLPSIASPGCCLFISHFRLHPARSASPLYAKLKKGGRAKRLGRKKNKGADGAASDSEPEPVDTAVSEAELEALFTGLRGKIKDSEDYLRNKISRLALHRVTPSLIESITVELPGSGHERQLQFLSRIMSKGNHELHVLPTISGNLDAIFCALSTKLVDYKVTMLADRVSVVVPSLTAAMVNQARVVVKESQQEAKAQIRIARQNALKKLNKMHEGLSDDMHFRQQKEVDKWVKRAESRVDDTTNDALRKLN